MNWLDIILGLLIAIGLVIGMVRGLGRTAFDALALYAALWIASALAPMLAAHVSFQAGGAGLNESWARASLFAVFGGLLLGVSWYVYSMTLWNAGMFDKFLGMCAGSAAGMIVAHFVVSSMVMGGAIGDSHREASASLGNFSAELYQFDTYHALMNTITGAGTYRRDLPDVGGK